MDKALTKKSINNLQKNAATMSDKDFKKQASSMMCALVNNVQSAMEEGKISSMHFYNGVNKETDVLYKMIESNEYTPAEKIEFSKRIAKLVDKLHKKDIIKDATILASIGALGLAIFSFIKFRK